MTRRKLRSNFERGTYRWAVRRAQWRALGIGDEDLEKPKIAVVNSSSGLASCFSHLDDVAAVVKDAIRAAGGLPFEIRTAAPADFITSAGRGGGYVLAARDLIPNDIEVAVEGALLDGMVCLASCDKTAPGQLMAAARLNIPSIVVACGYQASGEYRGRHVDIEDVFLHSMHVTSGQVSVEELEGMSANAIRSPGVCSGMGTANTMHAVCEALGMALAGTTPVAALSPKMTAAARRAGERIVAMVWEDLKPRDILSPAAFANAVKTVLAAAGSINAIKHLQAIAAEARVPVDVYALFDEWCEKVPVLCAVRPNGEHTIEQFEAAGGARSLMKRLAPLLDLGARTVDGRTLGENLAGHAVADADVIRPLDRPFAAGPAIVLLRGNLAPDYAVVKFGLSPGKARRFVGPAIAFHSADEALAALAGGRIRPGHVVVLRGLGPCGTPGMGMFSRVVFALDGAGLGERVAVVADGQQSGLVNKGLVVAEVSPGAAEGGPLALVQDGDPIEIDVQARRLELKVPEAVLAARAQRAWRAPAREERGWLGIYCRNVSPLRQGAVLTAAPPESGLNRP